MDEVSRQFWSWAAGVSCVKVRARDASLCDRGRDILAPWADELPDAVRAQTVPTELPTPGWRPTCSTRSGTASGPSWPRSSSRAGGAASS
eukprot:5337871-Alexandrium_andersonii.AAC.1